MTPDQKALRVVLAKWLHDKYAERPATWEKLTYSQAVWLKDADAILALPALADAQAVRRAAIEEAALTVEAAFVQAKNPDILHLRNCLARDIRALSQPAATAGEGEG